MWMHNHTRGEGGGQTGKEYIYLFLVFLKIWKLLHYFLILFCHGNRLLGALPTYATRPWLRITRFIPEQE